MEKIKNVYEVTQRLCGFIEPAGDSSIDKIRFENLEQTIDVVEKLISDIIIVSKNKDRYESSMKIAGLRADKFIQELKENLENL